MSTSNLFFKGCFDSNPFSHEALCELERLGIESDLKDKSCSREVNTCGMTLQQLIDTYEFYNDQKGLYRNWGDIIFPWEIKSTTNNLDYDNDTNDRWAVSLYKSLVSYSPGDRVLYIEDDGYRISLYEATEDVSSISGPFDKSKWSSVCSIELPEPFGLPTIEELRERYKYYSLSLFFKEWGEINADWEEDLLSQSGESCNIVGQLRKFDDNFYTYNSKNDLWKEITTSEAHCLSDKSSDVWDEAKVRKLFFYRRRDYAIVDSNCKDTLCLYVCERDLPASVDNLEKFKKFSTHYDFNGTWTSTEGSPIITATILDHPFKPGDTINVGVLSTSTNQPTGIQDHSTVYKDYVVSTIVDKDTFTYSTGNTLGDGGGKINILDFGPFWIKAYCVKTGINKCLELSSKKGLPNYQFVEIGSKGNIVEQPVPFYHLKGNSFCGDPEETLNEKANRQERRVLTQQEIDALDNTNSVYTYAITVQSASCGNRYFIDGVQQKTLNLVEGRTYRFNQSDSSNLNHPLRFSITSNGTHDGGTEFTEGVTIVGTAGSNGAYTEIIVPTGTPTLYYYCVNHPLMGGTAYT